MRQPDRAMARRTAACQHVYPEESLAIALVRRSRPCTGGLRQSALSDVKCAGDRHQAFTLPWLSLPRGQVSAGVLPWPRCGPGVANSRKPGHPPYASGAQMSSRTEVSGQLSSIAFLAYKCGDLT